MATLSLVNARTAQPIAERVEVAVTRNARRKGLLGRDRLAPSNALILAPCAAIHTMFMRFDIDAVFVDGSGRALKIVTGLGPWRIAMQPSAHAVVELPAGRLREHGIDVGDQLCLLDEDGERVSLAAADLRRHQC